MRSGLAVVLLDGDARVLGERLLELGDALFEGLLVRRLLDGRLDEAGLLACVRRDEEAREDAVADREAPADVAARALGPREFAPARSVVGADRVALRGVRERPTLQAGRACGGRARSRYGVLLPRCSITSYNISRARNSFLSSSTPAKTRSRFRDAAARLQVVRVHEPEHREPARDATEDGRAQKLAIN